MGKQQQQQQQLNTQDEEYLDYLADAFCHEAKKENDKFAIAAFALGAGIWGFSGNMIAGLAVGGCILLYSDRAVRASNRNLQFMEKTRVAAPFLPPDQFRDFERQFGREASLEQLKQAHEYGLPMQGVAEEFLFKHCPELQQQPKLLKSAATSPAALSAAAPQTVQALSDLLKQECPDLLLLVKAPPIRLVGHQRTGKSTFGRKLALLRMLLIPDHQVTWATPHHEEDNPVPPVLKPFGVNDNGGKDMRAIEVAWKSTQSRIDRGERLNLSPVWDEFGSYDQFSDLDCLGKSLKSMLREASKHECFPILIAHGDQAAFYPGVQGVLKTLQQATVKVETVGEKADEFGSMRPTGEVIVTWLDGTETRFRAPKWLTVDLLISLLPQPESAVSPDLAEPIPQPAISPNLLQPLPKPDLVSGDVEVYPVVGGHDFNRLVDHWRQEERRPAPQPQPEDPWRAIAADLVAKLKELNQNPDVQPRLSALKEPITKLYGDQRADLLWIAFLSAEKGEITAAMVRERCKRKPWFKELTDPVNEAIRQKFEELADRGIGDCFGEGDRRTFLLFENDDRTLTQDAWDTQDTQDDSENMAWDDCPDPSQASRPVPSVPSSQAS